MLSFTSKLTQLLNKLFHSDNLKIKLIEEKKQETNLAIDNIIDKNDILIIKNKTMK
jgi:hypothetical protein